MGIPYFLCFYPTTTLKRGELDKSIFVRANRIKNDIELKFSGLFQNDKFNTSKFKRNRKRSINLSFWATDKHKLEPSKWTEKPSKHLSEVNSHC